MVKANHLLFAQTIFFSSIALSRVNSFGLRAEPIVVRGWKATRTTILSAKPSGRGFGKQQQVTSTPEREVAADLNPKSTEDSTSLKSLVESNPPSSLSSSSGSNQDQTEENPAERGKRILREKYGLKTLEEQKLDAKKLENFRERQKQFSEWKKKLRDDDDEFDLMTAIPAPILVFVDRFLKTGLAVCGVLFVLAGIAITLEAWSKTSGEALPSNIDSFIVDIVEPNFTPGLLVLLGFSVSLGLFAAAQMGSQGAQYKEDKEM